MGWRDWFRSASAKETHASGGSVFARIVDSWQANRELPKSTDFRQLADEGYRRNLIVYSCIREKAQTVAEPELKCEVQGADGEASALAAAHPLVALLDRPNPEQGQFSFLELLMTHLDVAGNAYVHKVRSRMGKVVQLWLLRPDRIEIVPGPDGHVAGYKFAVGPSRKQDLPAEDVVHLKYPDPLNDYYGLSPICAAARAGDLDNNMIDWLAAFFLNGAEPRGFLKFKMRVAPEDRLRAKAQWAENHLGPRGWHSTAALDADVDYQETGKGPGDLAMDSISDQTESRICSAFGVPPILIGCAVGLKRSTYANYREAKRSFWEETLIPLYTRIADALTIGLAHEFATGNQAIVVRFDLSDIEALQESRQEQRSAAVQLYGGGVATKNEARVLAGLPRVVGGDTFRVSMDDLGAGEDAEIEQQGSGGPRIDTGGQQPFSDPYPIQLHRRGAA